MRATRALALSASLVGCGGAPEPLAVRALEATPVSAPAASGEEAAGEAPPLRGMPPRRTVVPRPR